MSEQGNLISRISLNLGNKEVFNTLIFLERDLAKNKSVLESYFDLQYNSTYKVDANSATDLSLISIKSPTILCETDTTYSVESEDDANRVDGLENTLSTEEQNILDGIKENTFESLYKSYKDSYMNVSAISDMSFRLGKVKETTTINRNGLYTPSNFSINFENIDRTLFPSSIFKSYQNLAYPPFNIETDYKNTIDESLLNEEYSIETFKTYRSNLTKREVGFKTLNDNINFLQYLLEQISGVVSTYLTEWDLSLYFQENIKLNKNDLIYLLYRIESDTPLGTTDPEYFLNYGVINSAISKIAGAAQKSWNPSKYPLSIYWTPLSYNNKIVIDIENKTEEFPDGTPIGSYPDFYDKDFSKIDELDFFEKVKEIDYKNAAMSGWTSFNMKYLHSIYNNSGDSQSTYDNNFNSIERGNKTYKDLILINKNNIIINNNESNGDSLNDGSEPDNRFLSTTDKATNYSTIESKKKSRGMGIPQKNPPLFGGPHGRELSPKSPQSFFQPDNGLMSLTPRVSSPIEYFDKILNESNTNNYLAYSTTKKNIFFNDFFIFDKNYCEVTSNNIIYPKEYDVSPLKALNLLKNGIVSFKNVTQNIEKEESKVYIDSYLENLTNRLNKYNALKRKSLENSSYNIIKNRILTKTNYPLIEFHSMPLDSWQVTEFEFSDFKYRNFNSGFWRGIRKIASNVGTSRRLYESSKNGESCSSFRLLFDGDVTTSYTFINTENPEIINTWNITEKEEDFINKYFDNDNNSITLTLCQSNSDRNTTLNNGPDSLISVKIELDYFQALVEKTVYKKRLKWYLKDGWLATPYWILESEKKEEISSIPYLKVVSDDVSLFLTRPDTTLSLSKTDALQVDFKETSKVKNFNFLSLFTNDPSYFMYDEYGYKDNSFHGVGILSTISGFDTNFNNRENLGYELGYEKKLKIEDRNETTIINAKRKYYSWSGSYEEIPLRGTSITGASFFYKMLDNPPKKYDEIDISEYKGLDLAITEILTNLTFYKTTVLDNDTKSTTRVPYYVSMETPLKILFNQISWQKTFLDSIKTFFCDAIDFNSIELLIKNMIDDRVYISSFGGNIISDNGTNTNRLWEDAHYYNYWIKKANEFFIETSEKSHLKSKEILSDSILKRKNSLDTSSKVLNYMVELPFELWTYKTLVEGYYSIFEVRKFLDSSNTLVEEYIMAYLNVLYEYRKFFINKRFNKEDGTLWSIRQLESVLQQFQEMSQIEEIPSFDELLRKQAGKQLIPIIHKEVFNKYSEKIAAGINNVKLEDDKIKTLYVQVEYVQNNIVEENDIIGNSESIYLTNELKKIEENTNNLIFYKEELNNLGNPEIIKDFFEKEKVILEKIKFYNDAILNSEAILLKYNIGKTRKGRYAYFPVNGKYILSSQEKIENYNKSNHNKINEDSRLYQDVEVIEDVFIDIIWKDDISNTPILYDARISLDMGKISSIKAEDVIDPLEIICSSSDSYDFWQIELPIEKTGYAKHYINKVNIQTVLEGDVYNIAKKSLYNTVSGPFSDVLSPIVDPEDAITSDSLVSSIISNI